MMLKTALAAAVILSCVHPISSAQSAQSNSTVTIQITDPTGANIPKARMRVVPYPLELSHKLETNPDGLVKVWPTTLPAARPIPGHGAAVTAASVSPNGQLIASASADKTARLWNLADGVRDGTSARHARHPSQPGRRARDGAAVRGRLPRRLEGDHRRRTPLVEGRGAWPAPPRASPRTRAPCPFPRQASLPDSHRSWRQPREPPRG